MRLADASHDYLNVNVTWIQIIIITLIIMILLFIYNNNIIHTSSRVAITVILY